MREIKYAVIIGGCYRKFDTYEEANAHLKRLEYMTGRKGTIKKVLG